MSKTLSVGAVILAAGEGARMGRRAKCLLRREGRPLIVRQLEILGSLGISNVVVVLGHYAEAIASVLTDFPVSCVLQAVDDHDQRSSLTLGLTALPDGLDAILVTPSDLPLLEAEDYRALLSAFEARPRNIRFVAPSVANQPGNPVVLDDYTRRKIIKGEGAFGSGRWRAQAFDWMCSMATTNEHYIYDVDTEEDIASIKSRFGVELVW